MLEECLLSLNNTPEQGTVKYSEMLQDLLLKSDCYDPISRGEKVALQTDIYKAVWLQAVELRKQVSY